MPRRNNKVREKPAVFHGATQYHEGYNKKCVGCFFVGRDFSCTTSDGKCLITHAAGKKKTKIKGKKKTNV